MATQNIIPTGNHPSWNQWAQGGGSSKWQNMDPSDPNPFSSSFISMTVISTDYQGFYVTAPAPRLAILGWTTYIAGGKNANMAQTYFGMYDSAVGWRTFAASWFDIFVWNQHGFSVGWAPTDAMIDSPTLLELCYNTDGDGSHPSYVNYFYSVFTYTPADMSFISIWNLIAPFIGAGLVLKDMARVNSWLRGNTNFSFEKHEYGEAFRQWKTRKFSRYFDLGARQWRIGTLPS